MLSKTFIEDYRAARAPRPMPYKPGVFYTPTATRAYRAAEFLAAHRATVAAWNALGGEIVPDYEASDSWEPGEARVRIVESADYTSLEDMEGEIFDPDVNPDIPADILAHERAAYADRLAQNGVWYYCAEVWSGTHWESVDGIGGMEGGTFDESAYDDDLMQAAMDKLAECEAREAAEIEEARPDMYAML